MDYSRYESGMINSYQAYLNVHPDSIHYVDSPDEALYHRIRGVPALPAISSGICSHQATIGLRDHGRLTLTLDVGRWTLGLDAFCVGCYRGRC